MYGYVWYKFVVWEESGYKFYFAIIGVIIASLKLTGTLLEENELQMIGRRRMAKLSVTCLDNTNGRGSSDGHGVVVLRSEAISAVY